MRELLDDLQRLERDGRVGRAVVLQTWGSAPRTAGAVLLVNEKGMIAGSVSGGCVEAATIEAVQGAIAKGQATDVSWTVTEDRAWEMGLACGGTVSLLIEPTIRPAIRRAMETRAGMAVSTLLERGAPAATLTVDEAGGIEVEESFPAGLVPIVSAEAARALASLQSHQSVHTEGSATYTVFHEVFPRRPTLFIVGAVHLAEVLARIAPSLGYEVVVADGRAAFLTRERFPEPAILLPLWPAEAFAARPIDRGTCVCVLSHDPKFDEPAVELALASEAAYVGAIGSRRTQAKRRERLKSQGVPEESIGRLHGPIGLDLGGRTPADVALAILAEVNLVRHGRENARRDDS